jgi:hypothetical protein
VCDVDADDSSFNGWHDECSSTDVVALSIKSMIWLNESREMVPTNYIAEGIEYAKQTCVSVLMH